MQTTMVVGERGGNGEWEIMQNEYEGGKLKRGKEVEEGVVNNQNTQCISIKGKSWI